MPDSTILSVTQDTTTNQAITTTEVPETDCINHQHKDSISADTIFTVIVTLSIFL